jgi:hypothetical protein
MRLVRAEMLEVLRTDYIKFARARGLTDRAVHFGHALKNTLVPVITITGLQLGGMIAFAIITETVFQWPGMGLLFIQAVTVRRHPGDGGLPVPDRADLRGDQPVVDLCISRRSPPARQTAAAGHLMGTYLGAALKVGRWRSTHAAPRSADGACGATCTPTRSWDSKRFTPTGGAVARRLNPNAASMRSMTASARPAWWG